MVHFPKMLPATYNSAALASTASRINIADSPMQGPPGLELPTTCPVQAWSQPMKVQPASLYAILAAHANPEVTEAATAGSESASSDQGTDSAMLLPVANSIADLQEVLQMNEHCRHFRHPPGSSIVQWSFTLQRKDNRALHRAVAMFLHDGVPLQVAGERCFSKKAARQCAAELAVAVIQRKELSNLQVETGCVFVELADVVATGGKGVRAGPAHVQQLRKYFEQTIGWSSLLNWQTLTTCAGSSNACAATLTLSTGAVEHTFHGPARESPEAACGELARRVLWYCGTPALQGLYQPDEQALLAAHCKVAPAPAQWMAALTEWPQSD
mmetsp:Transcript_34475/g.78665  ORF Transcript_34475/g.78665 Transcript_34475/m.78665 type:complete len:327 (-) Transcript_34475:115-1095(-)